LVDVKTESGAGKTQLRCITRESNPVYLLLTSSNAVLTLLWQRYAVFGAPSSKTVFAQSCT